MFIRRPKNIFGILKLQGYPSTHHLSALCSSQASHCIPPSHNTKFHRVSICGKRGIYPKWGPRKCCSSFHPTYYATASKLTLPKIPLQEVDKTPTPSTGTMTINDRLDNRRSRVPTRRVFSRPGSPSTQAISRERSAGGNWKRY